MATFTVRSVALATSYGDLAAAPGGPPALAPAMATATVPSAATDGKPVAVTPSAIYVVLTAAALGVGFVFAEIWHQTEGFKPVAGMSVFGPMYIVAQALERLQEPFVPWLGRAKTDSGPTLMQAEAAAKRDEAVIAARIDPANTDKAQLAAMAQRTVDQIRANLTLLLWGTSAALAMLASGFFGLYLLRQVGVASPPYWVDIVVTGLAIGGGTKPLHDLISNISSSKDAKKDPVETA